MTNYLHKGDLPADVTFEGDIAVDTEAMGLNNKRDRLCVVQLSDGKGDAHLVQFAPDGYEAPNLVQLLGDPARTKIFHFARFDLAIMRYYLGLFIMPVYRVRARPRGWCTYTDKHGYKDICRELLGVDVSKQQQSSDWGAATLTRDQVDYAAADVLYLHRLKAKLDDMMIRENRLPELAQACFDFPALPRRAGFSRMGERGYFRA